MPTTKHCGGKMCDRPCRGVSDCILRHGSAGPAREHYLPKIMKLLAAGPASLDTIAVTLDLRKDVAASYLRHMHHELREIRRWQERPGFSALLWRLGADPLLPQRGDGSTLSSEADESDMRQTVVPARQVGMQRDCLVAAFFGSGEGAAAC